MLLKKNMHKGIIIISIMILMYICTRNLNDNLCISVIGDEFGYWSSAAFFLNKQWHSLASTNSYYGWGYGILLAPIMMICGDDATLMYQMSIILNGIIVCGQLVVIYLITIKLSRSRNKISCALISSAVTLYSSSLSYIYYSMPEILLIFLTFLSVYLCVSIEQGGKYTNYQIYLLEFIGIYSFAVHQRTIGMLIAICIVLLIHYAKKNNRKIKDIIAHVIFFVFLLILCMLIKKYYKEWLYYSVTAVFDGENDFEQVTSTLANYNSIEALKQLLISIIGKLYYLFSATFLCGAVGFFVCIRNVLSKGLKKINIVECYLILIGSQAILISALFMPAGFEIRTDILIYGRYIEYCILPLMMYGLISISDKKINIKYYLVLVIVYFSFTIITSKNIASESINTNMGNIFAISDVFCIKGMENKLGVLYIYLRSVILYVVIILGFNTNKKNIEKLILLIVIIYNIKMFILVYDNNQVVWQRHVSECVNAVNIYKDEKGQQNNLYLFDAGIGAKMLQFLLPNEECITIDKIEMLNDNILVATAYNAENLKYIGSKYEVLYNNSIIILWRMEAK